MTAGQAINSIGQVKTVCGTVMTATYASSSNGSPTFLNLDRPYPNHIFTIVIWIEHRDSFGRPPEVLFADARVCITGFIGSYGGIPQIESRGGDIGTY